jgi:hypothetical protein
MKVNSTNTYNENLNLDTKENMHLHHEYPKVTFNLLDLPNKKTLKSLKTKATMKSPKNNNLTILKTKKSVKSSYTRPKPSPRRSNHLEPKKTVKKKSKSNYNFEEDVPLSKSSLNIKNNLVTKSFITKAKIAKTKSHYDTNSNQNQNKQSKLKQTKNNFLKLITKTNEGNYIREYSNSNSKYSLLYNNNVYEVYEGDTLDVVQKNLRNKILEMGKEAEFMEFEIGPLDISINRFNLKKKKKKILTKKTKDFERKKFEKNKKFIKTAIQKKHKFSQITSSNSNNLNSENILMNKSNQYLDDSSSKMNLNERKNMNIQSNMNFSGKMKISSSINKRSKYRSEKDSNFITSKTSNIKSSKNSSNNRNSKANIYERLTQILKPSSNRYDFQKKEKILTKSKTYSNSDSKIGQTIVESRTSNDKSNTLTSEKEIIVIDKEKFRVLSHKKLVYDSLDDEELIEDAIIENFYFEPNSYFVIIIDLMVLVLTFWSMVYKPLYLVINNCDVKNTITSITFNNISNLFVDVIFIIDLIINFFKSYYNFEEQLITKSNQIFYHYIKRFFFIDLISAIPYYSIIKFIALNRYLKHGIIMVCSNYYNHQINDFFQIFEILKLIKVLKCISRTNVATNYILNVLNSYTFFENWSYLIFNICLFFLLLHLTACIHIFISCTAYPNWIILNNLNYSSFPTIYLSSIYFLLTTVTSVGYGDIIGNTFTEFCFQIIILLVGIIAYSWLISSISNYVKENSKQSETLTKKISMLNEIKLEHPSMSNELYDKIYLHLEYSNLKQKKDKSSLIESLPHSITKLLLYEMYKPIIENFNFFKNFKNSEFIMQVISKLKPIIAAKNDMLLDQGEIIEETFFVKQGRLSLEVKIDAIHPEKSVQKLLDEEYFFGMENNELYQKSALGLMNMTSIKQTAYPTSINKKNLYNLYARKSLNENNINQKDIKSILTNDQGKIEVQKHNNISSNCIYLKILDIRKNEHFGALLMFLNKRSPVCLRVKTKKAELFFLKKIDAIEISSSYPNIWKRVNKASFHNLKQIKKIMHKIIRHFCETYGINFMKKICEENHVKNLDDLKKIYTMQVKASKYHHKNNFSVIYDNNQNSPKRFSALISKSQLKMLKEFINNSKTMSKHYEEKNIEQPDIKTLDLDNNDNIDNNDMTHSEKEKNFSLSKKLASSVENDSQMNCTLNVIKIKNNNLPSSKKEKAFVVVDDKNNSKNKLVNINKNCLSEENQIRNKVTFTKDAVTNYKNKNSKKTTQKLIENYGTPFYPEEINDEIYSEENQSKNNSKVDELEYIPVNYLLSSQNSLKNNYVQTINEFNINKINNGNKKPNNVTINNNFITNNVINNIQSMNIKNELSVFHFGFNFKSKKDESISYQSKQNNEENKIYNLAIFQNSFELSAIKNEEKIDVDLKKMMKNKEESKKTNNENKELNINDKNKKSSSFSSSSSNSSDSCSSCSNRQKNPKFEKSLTCSIPEKKIINSSSSSSSKIKENITENKGYKIFKNQDINCNAEYFNLNQITNGKFSKNVNFQNYIKSIILKKISTLTHSKIEVPTIRNELKNINLNRPSSIPKKKISKKYTAFFYSHNWRNEKLKNSFFKNQKINFIASDINDKGRGVNNSKKKIKGKVNNNTNLLNYINQNIKDDSDVLHNPGKFYGGLFNDIMKKYTRVNIKPFPK